MEQLAVIAGEILGGLLLIVLLAAAFLLIRRSRLSREGPLVLMAIRRGGRWRTGLARVGGADIAWFPIFGLGTRPRHRWERGELVLGPPSKSEHRPAAFADPVEVVAQLPDGTVDVVLARSDYTIVRSWSESAPPGLNASNVT